MLEKHSSHCHIWGIDLGFNNQAKAFAFGMCDVQ